MREQELRQAVVATVNGWLGAAKGSEAHHYIIDLYNTIKPLPRGVRMSYAMDWCAATVSAAFQECGLADLLPAECSCGLMLQGAKTMGIWVEEDDYRPRPGDICLYDWQDDGKGDNRGAPDHVGIVTSVAAQTFTVVEGNMGSPSRVGIRRMALDGRYIRGFITPDYAAKADKITEEETDMSRDEIKAMIDEAVQKAKEELAGQVYTTEEEAPAWARPAIRWAIEQGVLTGDEHGRLHLTLDNLVNLQMLYKLEGEPNLGAGKEGE